MILLALWIILGLIVLAIALSFVPFSVYIKLKPSLGAVNNNGGFGYQTVLYWSWRLLGIGFGKDSHGQTTQLLFANKCIYKRKKLEKLEGEKEKKPKKKKEKSKKKFSEIDFRLLLDRELIKQLISVVLSFLRDIIRCIRRPHLTGDVELGFSDPAAMGVISGFMYAISPKGMVLDDLRIRPNYVDAIFYGELEISTGVQPARVLGAFIKLLFRLPKRKLWRIFRSKKKTAKQEV